MCRWLDGSRESKIPPFASHQVGVCGVVLREDTQEILVTQDKYKPARWKFPGGISEFAEKISDTAEREVLEETGIVAKFNSIIAFRQHHKIPTAFDQSDLYFICHMTPLSYDITPCQDEILKCQWVGLRELQLSPQATQLTNRIAELILEGLKDGFDNIHIIPEEWPSLIPGYTYELFMKKSVTKND
jgi:8-oxo-dGTP pyrophosphatase MutT (NUDIX family)